MSLTAKQSLVPVLRKQTKARKMIREMVRVFTKEYIKSKIYSKRYVQKEIEEGGTCGMPHHGRE